MKVRCLGFSSALFLLLRKLSFSVGLSASKILLMSILACVIFVVVSKDLVTYEEKTDPTTFLHSDIGFISNHFRQP